jgi:phospholipid/cholesterol/gamma-HCH transport system substrate-binding protein
MSRVDALLDKMSNGNGTVARLLNDSALADDLDAVTRETQGLMKDFRANPKKFLRIELKLF